MPEKVIHSRGGLKHEYVLQPGEAFAVVEAEGPWDGVLVVTTDETVKLIDVDGQVTEFIMPQAKPKEDEDKKWNYYATCEEHGRVIIQRPLDGTIVECDQCGRQMRVTRQ